MKIKLTAEQFSELIHGGVGYEIDGFKVEEDGDWVSEGKYEHKVSIIKKDGKYFSIGDSRSGDYYTEYYYTSEEDEVFEIDEVEKKEIVSYKWVNVK